MPNCRTRLLNASISAVIGAVLYLIISLAFGNEISDWRAPLFFFVTAFVIDFFVKTVPIWNRKDK
ncbi:hypothetical protein SD71_00730 [Cohnella kolymensis]|uniref:Uncharacterized protein n=1 Tax=Cohnella kolymensis TaxID=1590652 RepID=A0ABR5A8A1_9BACL|nr:hypothetical protein SD71_00730 [Cohnella kolymensis]